MVPFLPTELYEAILISPGGSNKVLHGPAGMGLITARKANPIAAASW
jgi:hypothetical protein